MISGFETAFLLGVMAMIAVASLVSLRLGASQNQVFTGMTIISLLAIVLAVA